MSPREALQSPVAMFYLALVFGLLFVAGPILWLVRKRVEPAWQSYRGWLVMVPITAAALFLGRESAIVFLTGVGLLGFWEFARATGLSEDGYMVAGVSLGILAVGLATLVPDPGKAVHGWFDLFMTLPALVVPCILVIPILRNRVTGQLHALALAIAGFLFFGWMFGHVTFLANSKNAYAYLAYLLFAVEVDDIAAFLAGKLFGRHVLRSNISPKKTWEGSLGALAVSLALPWALWWTFPHLGPVDLLAVGLIVGIGGQIGDLAISVIKRDLGIKDMGATIPGHGGILDRIDSLIYVAPLFFHYLRYRHDLSPLP
jgi:phosphatidate cytidylyltransferase